MAGAGYNIPISVSAAGTAQSGATVNAGTVFNFSSPGSNSSFSADPQTTNDAPATATSAAAEGNAAASSTPNTNVGLGGSAAPSSTNWLLIGGIGIAAWFFLKHKH